MPLLQIVGMTATNKTFLITLTFLNCETESSYRVLLRHLNDLYTQLNIEPPTAILSDQDTSLMKAIKMVFPIIKSMVCLWHINMNIMKKVRPILQRSTLELMINEDL